MNGKLVRKKMNSIKDTEDILREAIVYGDAIRETGNDSFGLYAFTFIILNPLTDGEEYYYAELDDENVLNYRQGTYDEVNQLFEETEAAFEEWEDNNVGTYTED